MASNNSRRRVAADYTVACICPMGFELAPVEAMLDEIHDPLPTIRDQKAYTLGHIGGHNIIIAIMSEIGNNTAATVVTQLLNDFPSVRFGLLVGIGGGVPGTADVRLGDVVVSQSTDTFGGVVQYDLGKRTGDGTFRRMGLLKRPPLVLSANLHKLQSRHRRQGHQLSQLVSEMLEKYPNMQLQYRQPTTKDRLFEKTYRHSSDGNCEECDVEQIVKRPTRSSQQPAIHYGTIGSANIVLKDGVLRDKLHEDMNLLCVETEAAGLMTDFPCLVIRGIYNYADSHKNEEWRPYAAAVAAAYMREFLSTITPQEAAPMALTTHTEQMSGSHREAASPSLTLNQLDGEIHKLYCSGRRLIVERLSGEPLSLEYCFVNLSIIQDRCDIDFLSASNNHAQERVTQQTSQFSLAARLRVATPFESRQLSLDTLFEPRLRDDGTEVRPNRVLIWGQAGMGKTTLCKKIVHDFYKNGQWKGVYNRVIWLPLRRLRRSRSQNVVELLESEFPSVGLCENASEAFDKLVDDKRTLFLLDGLDEVASLFGSDSLQERVLRELLARTHVIVTSRPSSTHDLGLQRADLELELVGLSELQSNEYLKNIANDSQAEDKISEVRSFIQQHPLARNLAAIPVQLDAICYCWSAQSFLLDVATMTDLYLTISMGLWRKNALRLQKEDQGKLITKKQLAYQKWQDFAKLIGNEIVFLQALAFQGLCDGVIEFTVESIEILEDIQLIHGDAIMQLIFLRTSDDTMEAGNRTFHFIHLTFQEFFAAQHFVRCWVSNKALKLRKATSNGRPSSPFNEVTPEDFVQSRKYFDQYDIFWRFVIGLLQVEDKGHLHRFLDILESGPIDLVGLAHQRLIIHCVSELHKGDDELQSRTRRLEDAYVQWSLCQSRLILNRNKDDLQAQAVSLLWETECSNYIMQSLLFKEETEVTALNVLRGRSKISHMLFDAVVLKLYQPTSVSTENIALQVIGTHCTHGREAKILDLVYGSRPPRLTTLQVVEAWGNTPRLLEPAINLLIQLLKDSESHVRSRISDVLRRQTLPDLAIGTVTQLLRHPTSNIRFWAANALGGQVTLSDTAIVAFIQLLQDPDIGTRGKAAEALAKQVTLSDTAMKVLTQLLRHPDRDIRSKAAEALSGQAILSDTTVEALTQLLQDPDRGIRSKAAEALSGQAILPDTTVEALTQLLRHPDNNIQSKAAEVLRGQAILPDATVEVLTQLLRHPDRDIRSKAAEALRDQAILPDATVEALTQLLQDPDRGIRSKAAEALRDQAILPDATVEALTQLLRHPDRDIRSKAAEALRDQAILSDTTVEVLIQLLRHPDNNIRSKAAEVLSGQAILPDATVEALIQLLRHPGRYIRSKAAEALRDQPILSDTTVEALIQLLRHPGRYIRSKAAEALRDQPILSDTTVEALTQLLQDPDRDVRNKAAVALGKQATLPDTTVEAFTQLLQDPDRDVRNMAAVALGKQATLPDTTVEALTQLLQDPDRDVRNKAAVALGKQATLPDTTVEALTQLLQDPDRDVRSKAAVALGKQATLSGTVVKELIQLLQNPDQLPLTEAIALVAKRHDTQALIPTLSSIALHRLLQYLLTTSSEVYVVEERHFCILSSQSVRKVPLQQHQLRQFETQWQVARKHIGLPELRYLSKRDHQELDEQGLLIVARRAPERSLPEQDKHALRMPMHVNVNSTSRVQILPFEVLTAQIPGMEMRTMYPNVLRDLSSYDEDLSALQSEVLDLFAESQVFSSDYTDFAMLSHTLRSNGSISPEAIANCLSDLYFILQRVAQSIKLVQDIGDPAKIFSIMVESSRLNIINVVSVAEDSVQVLIDMTKNLWDFVEDQLERGSTVRWDPLMRLQEVVLRTFEYLTIDPCPVDETNEDAIMMPIFYARIMARVLTIGIVSFVTSHIFSHSQVLFNRVDGQALEVCSTAGYQLTFEPRNLACLKSFIGGPVCVFSSYRKDAEYSGHYAVSIMLADFHDLWGPARIVYSSTDPKMASEVVTFGGRLRAVIDSSNHDFEHLDDEILCHWFDWKTPPIDCQDFDPTKSLLIGSPTWRTNPRCINPERQTYYQKWTTTTIHTEGERVEKKGYSNIGTLRIPLIGTLGRSRQYQINPQKSAKMVLIDWFYNMNLGIPVKAYVPDCIDEVVCLEISRCTGNALRVSLWDMVRNPDMADYIKDLLPDEIGSLPYDWTRYTTFKEFSKLPSTTAEQRDNISEMISTIIRQIMSTGIGEGGKVTAWDVGTSEARIFQSDWANMLTDDQDTATFAFLSSRCLVYEFGRSCAATRAALIDKSKPVLFTRIEITVKASLGGIEIDSTRFGTECGSHVPNPVKDVANGRSFHSDSAVEERSRQHSPSVSFYHQDHAVDRARRRKTESLTDTLKTIAAQNYTIGGSFVPRTSSVSSTNGTQQPHITPSHPPDHVRLRSEISNLLSQALQNEKITYKYWILDNNHGLLHFDEQEQRCVQFGTEDFLHQPLRMKWQPLFHKLDPTIHLARFDKFYEEADHEVKKLWSRLKGYSTGEVDVKVKFMFREAKQIMRKQHHKAMKWVCISSD